MPRELVRGKEVWRHVLGAFESVDEGERFIG